MKPPFTDVDIKTAYSGFYEGYSVPIALVSKLTITLLVIWALIWPLNAKEMLSTWNGSLLNIFNSFYIIAVGCFAFFLFAIAIWPSSGRRVLGRPGEGTEFSTFSWFAMMFGAGLGVGLMVFATAEPIGLWGSNPELLAGAAAPNTEEALQSAYRYTFAHYGFHAWAIYVVTGLSLAYYAFTRDMPLTIRSALTPLFGSALNGALGHIVDILGVVATILGVGVTIGFGVSQLVEGVYSITSMEWLMTVSEDGPPAPSSVGLVVGLVVIMSLSILSAVSGVGRGVKYLSNLNLVLSLILLGTFVVAGSFVFAMTTYGSALIDYLINFVQLSFASYSAPAAGTFEAAIPEAVKGLLSAEEIQTIYATGPWGDLAGFKEGLPEALKASEGFDASAEELWGLTEPGRLFKWQAAWTTFYWAWWIAFSPFVGLFLARISRGRTVREFILGAVIAPALVCFAWMTILGGTAIDLEISGVADGAIIAASNTNKLFVTLSYMLDGQLLNILTIMCVVLILTFLVTSADSGILVMNTIMSGGSLQAGIKHRIIWGVLLTLIILALLLAGGGGLSALQNAMIIGALPFTMIMVLMCISLAKALIRDAMRDKRGIPTTPTAADR